MPDLILHHYPVSPFAEKVRLVLGYKKLAWKSVIIPSIMPKPDLVALTGGYRRTPVLQIGADIYCDTALICDVLEQLRPAPALHPQGGNGGARIVAQWAASTLFAAAMAYCFSPKGAAFFFQGQPPEVAKAFAEDRAMIEAQQARLAMDGGFKMVNLGIDSALSQFRWMVNKQIDTETKSAATA